MSVHCRYRHDRPIKDILTDPKVLTLNLIGPFLFSLPTSAILAYLFKSRVLTNCLISLTVLPTHHLFHTIDGRITKDNVKCHSPSHQLTNLALTILSQFALIYGASSLFGRKISYLWAPINTITTLCSLGMAVGVFFALKNRTASE